MRLLPFFPLLFLLAACASTAPYTKQDLQQVREVHGFVVPDYENFKAAYLRHDDRVMQSWYYRSEADCRIEDRVDKRDTIDPNTKLFEASALQDSICNDIEAAWTYWRKAHHLRYDKALVPAALTDAWQDGDLDVKKIPALLRHPRQLS